MQNAATNVPTKSGSGAISTVSDIKFKLSDINKKCNHILIHRKTSNTQIF
jgi:hypothetical protein